MAESWVLSFFSLLLLCFFFFYVVFLILVLFSHCRKNNQRTRKQETKKTNDNKNKQKTRLHTRRGSSGRELGLVFFCFFWFLGFCFCLVCFSLAIAEKPNKICQWLRSSGRTITHVQCQWLQNAVKKTQSQGVPFIKDVGDHRSK